MNAPQSTLDRFAEYLANGLDPHQAAERMGHNSRYGNAMLQRIRQQLGKQAI